MAAPIARANPVTKLAVSSLICFALLLSVDAVTSATALGLEALVLPWCGLSLNALWRKGWIIIAGALPAAVATAVFAVHSGGVLWAAGPLQVTTGSAESGLAIGLRIMAIGLPGVVLLATTDPTDLADALAQNLKLPHRFVLSALAALRLFGVLAEQWRALTLARRARGIGGDGVIATARDVWGRVFAMLVLAIRQATILATTMEARGFGVRSDRTWARPSRFTPIDAVVLAGGVAIAGAATAAGIAAGTWRLVLG